jgi:hypothetical protein
LSRLFLGIAAPDYIRIWLALIASGLSGTRWIRKEFYHLTLRYISEVDQGTASLPLCPHPMVRGTPDAQLLLIGQTTRQDLVFPRTTRAANDCATGWR